MSTFDRRGDGERSIDPAIAPDPPSPGKHALTARLPARGTDAADEPAGFRFLVGGNAVQRRVAASADPMWFADDHAVRARAQAGVAGGGERLPHHDAIQAAFGRHDVSGVRAHVGGDAASAATDIGAEAYATGSDVAFARPPDLFTAAHEAAHVVQQRNGVQLLGGVGAAGDRYERHADEVATLVVRGESAEAHLDELAGAGGASGGHAVQRKISFSIGSQKQFADLAGLKRALKATFAEAHHGRIDEIVDAAEAEGGRPYPAVNVFDQVVQIGAREGWARVAQPSSSTNHGPQLPRLNATHTGEDHESAMSTFMFGSVTIGRADLMLPGGRVVSFEGRNDSGEGTHAEDELIADIERYLKEHRVDPSKCRLRITLNNLPCHDGKGEKDCAQTLSNFAVGAGFVDFHIYYANNYGQNVKGSIGTMQGHAIAVSQFAPSDAMSDETRGNLKKRTRDKVDKHRMVPPSGVDLDSHSESESDEEPDEEGPPGMLQDVSGRGLNCLIRALLVAAGFGEDEERVTQLRQRLVQQGVAQEGRMLDLANAAGALLISQIAPLRGVEVYVPGRRGALVVVAGPNPVRLWLADEHFQAIL